MLEAQVGGVQGQARRPAAVRQWFAVDGSIVHALAADRRARLAKMDTDLVRAAGFEPALDQREVAQFLQDMDVRNGPLPSAALGGASTPAIAAIGNQTGLDPL